MNFDFHSIVQFISTNPIAMLIVLGFAVGLASRILMPGPDPMGIVMTTLLGIGGSFVGGYGASYTGVAISGTWMHVGASIMGSLVLLLIYKFIRNV